MGLNCSHGAFDGAYSAFNRLRKCVAEAAGGSFPPHYDLGSDFLIKDDPSTGRAKVKPGLDPELFYVGDDWPREKFPGLFVFLAHSDCDGEISPEECTQVADDLEKLLPHVEALGWPPAGHIERAGGYPAALRKFIAGCRKAAAAGKPLKFG